MNFEENILLENGRVRIEALQNFHFEALLSIAINQPNLLQYSPSLFGSSTNLKKYIQNAITARKEKQRYPFVIWDKLHQKYSGSTSYGNISINDKRLEIGWTWIEKALHGSGLNANCKYLLLSYAFDQLHFERVEFKIDERNIQSQKAVEKIGAIREGVLRSHTFMLDGYRRNTVYYSILRNEWKETVKTKLKQFIE